MISIRLGMNSLQIVMNTFSCQCVDIVDFVRCAEVKAVFCVRSTLRSGQYWDVLSMLRIRLNVNTRTRGIRATVNFQ